MIPQEISQNTTASLKEMCHAFYTWYHLYYNGILDIKKWYMNFSTMVYFKVHSATTGLLCKGYIHLKKQYHGTIMFFWTCTMEVH